MSAAGAPRSSVRGVEVPCEPELTRLAGDLRARAEASRERLVARLVAMASIDAPSGDAERLAGAETHAVEELAALGATVVRHPSPAGTHLEATFGPAAPGEILILGHYDTVWEAGTASIRPPRVADGLVHGPGVFDMRGGIVVALGALELLGGERRTPVRVLLTADEETGSATSRELIVDRARRAAAVLVMEPALAGGGLKTSRRGWGVYRAEVRGRSAHAGLEPERGVNAIDELVDALIGLRRLASPEMGTEINVGVIEGGVLPNIVPAAASALIDVRVRTPVEHARVQDALRSVPPVRAGAEVWVREVHARPPMERTDAVAAAAARAAYLGRLLDAELSEGTAGGTSDANLVAPLGVPVLDGLGPDGGGAHAVDERVRIDSLVDRVALLGLLIAGL